MTLQRLVVDFRSGELVLRVLYRSEDGPNGTKTRCREVTKLVRAGLQKALSLLEGDTELVGTSGFTTREDVLAATSPDAARRVNGGLWDP